MSGKTLRRYTNLASALHIIQNKCLTLLSPATWDDRNDAFFLSEFKKRKKAATVLALCFAEAPDTYHHWRVFSHGSDGVCLEFHKEKLEKAIPNNANFRADSVDYKTIAKASSAGLTTDDLPFVKRYAFKDELEFRLIYIDMTKMKESESLPISLSCISRITVSPWLSRPLFATVKNTIRGQKGCGNLKVYRSTLIENESWKRLGNPKLKKTV